MQYDAATGMYWTANRVYDPSTGRWYTQDPLGLTADSNLYRYVDNGPTDGTDPTGQWLVTYDPAIANFYVSLIKQCRGDAKAIKLKTGRILIDVDVAGTDIIVAVFNFHTRNGQKYLV